MYSAHVVLVPRTNNLYDPWIVVVVRCDCVLEAFEFRDGGSGMMRFGSPPFV